MDPYTNLEITKAHRDVINAQASLRDAEDNLALIMKPTDELIIPAQLAIAKAEQALDEAVEFRNTLKTPSQDDIAKAEAGVATVRVNLKNANTALEELLEPVSDNELAKKRWTSAISKMQQ